MTTETSGSASGTHSAFLKFLVASAALGGAAITAPTVTQASVIEGPMLRAISNASRTKSAIVEALGDDWLTDAIGDNVSSVDENRQTTDTERAIAEVRELARLEENWDGEGSARPARDSVKGAVAFLKLWDEVKYGFALEPQPLASGRVSLSWEDDAGQYIEIEFIGENRIAYFYSKSEAARHKGSMAFTHERIPKVLSALLQG